MGTTLVVNEVLCAPLIYRLMQYQKTDVFSTQIVEFMGWKASLVPRLSNNRESLNGILVNCFLWSIPPLVPFVPPTNQFLLLVHTMHILASIHTHTPSHTHHHTHTTTHTHNTHTHTHTVTNLMLTHTHNHTHTSHAHIHTLTHTHHTRTHTHTHTHTQT